MSRSLKKPPFVHYKLMKRVDDAQAANSKSDQNMVKSIHDHTRICWVDICCTQW